MRRRRDDYNVGTVVIYGVTSSSSQSKPICNPEIPKRSSRELQGPGRLSRPKPICNRETTCFVRIRGSWKTSASFQK